LREDGYEVVHFTWDHINDTPQRVAASIRAAFQRGARNATRPGVLRAVHARAGRGVESPRRQ
jgi:hypothetical protein